MEKKLFKRMNWPEIEAICYSEHQQPHSILGPHLSNKQMLVQVFLPDVEAVKVLIFDETSRQKEEYPMELVDEAGFYAVLIPKKTIGMYRLEYVTEGQKKECIDPYQFLPTLTKLEAERFHKGVDTKAYELLGAHIETIQGIKGVRFRVFAKETQRISVVGDFNHFDGRLHQMTRVEHSDIYEIFIPGLDAGANYLFELKLKSGLVYRKGDPYAREISIKELSTCVVPSKKEFPWTDQGFIKNRKTQNHLEDPISILEVYLPSFQTEENQDYSKLAKPLISYMKETGYTHVELLPLCETFQTESLGYETIGYFAPSSRLGKPEEFKAFINELHKNQIYVILDWVAGFFPEDNWGLSAFDGSRLYEQEDSRNMYHGKLHTLLFQYQRNEVRNFLFSSAFYFLREFHIDGLRIGELGSILYLNYGKPEGYYTPNIYGGPENLEGIDFLRQLNTLIQKELQGVITIAEDSTDWPMVTENSKDGLGFTYKWNNGFHQDMKDYLSYDPYFRAHHHQNLIQSMTYHYGEHYILNYSHDMVIHENSSYLELLPGTEKEKLQNWKLALGYLFALPGKKHLFMGQDFGSNLPFHGKRYFTDYVMSQPEEKSMKKYLSKWNELYTTKEAFYQLDYVNDGFAWINEINRNDCTISFLRKADSEKFLIFIANFANVYYEKYEIGVPVSGNYKEIINSDMTEFAGENRINKRILKSKDKEKDGRKQSIRLRLAPLSCLVMEYRKNNEE